MEPNWKDNVHQQRTQLAHLLHGPLARLAGECVPAWGDRERLNGLLGAALPDIPYCNALYALDPRGIQMSDSVGRDGLVAGQFGLDRSACPFLHEPVPPWGFLLSDGYISRLYQRPSLTALHLIRSGDQVQGQIAADFDLRDLPATGGDRQEPRAWRQIKGDPAIRGHLFQQSRMESLMDRDIDQALSILEELATERGMFQAVIHFSSSRVTAWFVDDPHRYRLIDHEALADADICLTCPRQPYPAEALTPREAIPAILREMRTLRLTDQTIYLRAASINIFNGLVSLTFSCDGTHYMGYEEFLNRSGAFWRGMNG